MAFAKRIILFLLLNLLVITMISVVMNFFNIRPYLTAYGLDYKSLMIFCLLWGFGGAFISLALSRVMAKWSMGVQVIDLRTNDPELRKLLDIVHSLAKEAGLPAMPEVGIYRSNEVNAFATGPSRSRSLVAVSTGLLNRMETEELRGVLAHEISHVANGDMVTMTLLQGVVNAFVMFLARALAYILSGAGRGGRENNVGASYILFVFLFQTVFMILGSILVATYSRFREYRADRGGASLAGKQAMISALQTLKALQEVKDPRDSANSAIAAFKISHLSNRGLLSLFASHPPLEDRIERLRKLSA